MFEESKDHNGRIIITDNGDGMTKEDITKRWMVTKYFKKREQQSRTKKRRIATNRKMGKFVTEKLAEKVTISTKSNSEDEKYAFTVNRDDYDKPTVTFEDISSPLVSEESANQESGTTIILENLRAKWSEAKIQQFRTAVSLLILPKTLQKIKNDPLRIKIHTNFETEFSPDVTSALFDDDPYRIESLLKDGKYEISVFVTHFKEEHIGEKRDYIRDMKLMLSITLTKMGLSIAV